MKNMVPKIPMRAFELKKMDEKTSKKIEQKLAITIRTRLRRIHLLATILSERYSVKAEKHKACANPLVATSNDSNIVRPSFVLVYIIL